MPALQDMVIHDRANDIALVLLESSGQRGVRDLAKSIVGGNEKGLIGSVGQHVEVVGMLGAEEGGIFADGRITLEEREEIGRVVGALLLAGGKEGEKYQQNEIGRHLERNSNFSLGHRGFQRLKSTSWTRNCHLEAATGLSGLLCTVRRRV